jgi:hypothetical protein
VVDQEMIVNSCKHYILEMTMYPLDGFWMWLIVLLILAHQENVLRK